MKLYPLLGIFGSIFLAVALSPAMAQTNSIADHVVINEVDINPPGDDSKTITEWVELYNPTDSPVNIGGWKIASTSVLKKTLTVAPGTTIGPEKFLTFSYQSLWFTDASERVELRDAEGLLVDATPSITDLKNDFTSWQRIYDGFDTNSQDDWTFETSSAGSTNGKLTQEAESEQTNISISMNKEHFIFGETAVISGEVSERIFIEKPYFQPAKITIKVTGPAGYQKTISLFPDLFLKFKTELPLREVLGVTDGIYNVSAEYSGSTDSAQFSLGDQIIEIEEKEQATLSITTDKESYLPGETVKITGFTSEIIPLEGLKFKVLNSQGNQIFDGSLYPNTEGKFSTTIFMTTVSPSYGTHTITGQYLSQSASSTFELSEEVKEEKVISLRTDKKVYSPGDVVLITGRLNNIWIFSLDLEITQTGSLSLQGGASRLNKVLDAVRLEGDGTFSYEYKIPNNLNSLGDYRITVSKNVGTETEFFTVVEDPETFVEQPARVFYVDTDKASYQIGDTITISGKVQQTPSSSQVSARTVDIKIKSSEGKNIYTSTFKPSSNKPGVALYSLSAVPDISGNYQVRDTLYRTIYGEGTFTVTASYGNGVYTDTTTFSVIDPLNIEGFGKAWIDKEVYGLGETVTLNGLLKQQTQGVGIKIILLKPSGEVKEFGTLVDNGRFSWSWTTPTSEKPSAVKSPDARFIAPSNYGIYKITVKTNSNSMDLFFKVSPNPETDTLSFEPLSVTTEKPVYNAGEKLKVAGSVLKRAQGTEGLVVPERVQITVSTSTFPTKQIHESSVFLNAGGGFQTLFDLPLTVFKEGTYKVTATYNNQKAETVFQVNNPLLTQVSDELSLLISTDKEQYHPGDVVKITARPTKAIYPDFIRLGIPGEEQTALNCGSFVCGKGVPITEVRPNQNGIFYHEHKIPTDPRAALGTFIITFDTEFGTFKKPFEVVEKQIIEPQPEPQLADRIIEKTNRIPDAFIQISVEKKMVNDTSLSPRVIQGSLFTPNRGQESNVNLKVSTESGVCVIGPADQCMVSESTRVPGEIYKIVEIDQMQYNIRYSGPDVTLEKFTILPVSDEDVLPDSTWKVEVIKEDQSSRFYYKVTYVSE